MASIYKPNIKNFIRQGREGWLQREWDGRNSDYFAYIPHNLRQQISPKKAQEENKKFGDFASAYLQDFLDVSTLHADVPKLRVKNRSKLVTVGYGRGYDAPRLLKIFNAGLKPWIIDVSKVGCYKAQADLRKQCQEIQANLRSRYKEILAGIKKPYREINFLDFQPKTVIIAAEIRAVLEHEINIGLDLETVEIWYLCRLLNCLPDNSARLVLRRLGETTLSEMSDRFKRKAIIIINAFKDDNPDLVGVTSIIRSKRMILNNIARGAGRPVEPYYIKRFDYFTQRYTAMCVMAKK